MTLTRTSPPLRAPVSRRAAGSVGYVISGILFLTAANLLAHAWCINDGAVLDDHWHQKGLREHGWTLSELLRTLNIAPSDFMHTWWQTKYFCWDYLRPIFILSMKFVYLVIGHGDARAIHSFSVLLHGLTAIFVWRLCLRLTGSRFWSLVGGLLVVVYPHAVMTVAWPSAQNVVLETTLVLAAVLAYVRASGLAIGPNFRAVGNAQAGEAPPLSRRWFALTIVLWLMAVLTRENAVLVPAIFLAFDVAFGGRHWAWSRRGAYALIGLCAIVFVVWRMSHVPQPLPDVYMRRPDGEWLEYLAWLAAKLVHYLCASTWICAMAAGPPARFNPWTEATGDCVLMLGIIAVNGIVYWAAVRRARGGWIWPLWILLSGLPVLAIIATPHSVYMSVVGFAVAAGIAPALARAAGRRWIARVAGAGAIFYAVTMAGLSYCNRCQWLGVISAERLAPSWIRLSPPPDEARDIFLINIPFVNIYIKEPLVEVLHRPFDSFDVHVLTYAPQVVEMDQGTVVEQLDAHSFEVSVPGQPYFSRLLGRFLLEAFRGKKRFETGQEIDGSAFRVRIVEADAEGVRRMRFTFPRPLNDPSYCFYVTTTECGAARLRFPNKAAIPEGEAPAGSPDGADRLLELNTVNVTRAGQELESGQAAAAETLFSAAASGDPELAASAEAALRPMAKWLAAAIASPIQGVFEHARFSQDDWSRLRDWWHESVDDRLIAETWLHRNDFYPLIRSRWDIWHSRYWAGRVLHSDLYLSGPPFPGPRGY